MITRINEIQSIIFNPSKKVRKISENRKLKEIVEILENEDDDRFDPATSSTTILMDAEIHLMNVDSNMKTLLSALLLQNVEI